MQAAIAAVGLGISAFGAYQQYSATKDQKDILYKQTHLQNQQGKAIQKANLRLSELSKEQEEMRRIQFVLDRSEPLSAVLLHRRHGPASRPGWSRLFPGNGPGRDIRPADGRAG